MKGKLILSKIDKIIQYKEVEDMCVEKGSIYLSFNQNPLEELSQNYFLVVLEYEKNNGKVLVATLSWEEENIAEGDFYIKSDENTLGERLWINGWNKIWTDEIYLENYYGKITNLSVLEDVKKGKNSQKRQVPFTIDEELALWREFIRKDSSYLVLEAKTVKTVVIDFSKNVNFKESNKEMRESNEIFALQGLLVPATASTQLDEDYLKDKFESSKQIVMKHFKEKGWVMVHLRKDGRVIFSFLAKTKNPELIKEEECPILVYRNEKGEVERKVLTPSSPLELPAEMVISAFKIEMNE